MNYLAHAFLSFGDPAILTGNMISDFVKGRKQYDFAEGIQRGISFHREIDEFTDRHAVTHQAKAYFKSAYRLYSGAFVDVVYDHFLANDRQQFPSETHLQVFSLSTYRVLEDNIFSMPEQFQQMFPYMKQHDWLYNYRLKEGIEKSFGGVVRRAVYLSDAAPARKIFNEHYDALQDCYNAFFPQLKDFSISRMRQLSGK